jgi:hypothetical protein
MPLGKSLKTNAQNGWGPVCSALSLPAKSVTFRVLKF